MSQSHRITWTSPGLTNLFAIAGHFVSYRWVTGPHNFLVMLWNLLKTKKLFINKNKIRSGSKKVQDCWSRLNASRAARISFAGRMFVTLELAYSHSRYDDGQQLRTYTVDVWQQHRLHWNKFSAAQANYTARNASILVYENLPFS